LRSHILNIVVFVFTCCTALGQDRFYHVTGTVKASDGKFDNAYVAVNGEKNYLDSSGSFDVKLPFQEDNILIFGRKGSVQQIIDFNTTVSKERIEESFYPKEINIVLFDKVEGIDLALMKEPVEIYSYNEDQYDFDSDEKYALEMRAKIETLKAAIEEVRKQGKLSEEMIAKAKLDAEQQKLLQEKTKQEALERLRIEKERMALEDSKLREEEARLEAEEAAKRKAEREKKRQEEMLKEQEELRLAKEQEDAELAEKQKQREELSKKKLEENRNAMLQDSILKANKIAALKMKEEQRLTELKAKEEAAQLSKEQKEKAFKEAEEKRLAEEKLKAESLEKERKEKEDAARNASLAAKEKAEEDAKRKSEEMAALRDKFKSDSDEAEKKRQEQLSKQEELFKNKQSKFKPVMGIYTNTNTVIRGKKAHGYINFGNGLGNQDLTKEEYDTYKEKYK